MPIHADGPAPESPTELRPGNVPDALCSRDQWLCWDRRADKPKRPHWDGDHTISWSDPDAWHGFAEALGRTRENNAYGLGYVTAAENDDHPVGVISVIDIDGGRDPETGELAEWVPDLDPFRDAYAELSPSETGLHIPVVGTGAPDWWRDSQIADHEGIDLLQNKFCTVTGWQLDGFGDDMAQWDDDVRDWLAAAYEALTGEQPARPDDGQQSLDDVSSGDSGEYDDEWLTEEVAREALSHIDPDLGHDRWRDIGFALEDHFPQRTAKRLFERWSRGGSKWDSSAERYRGQTMSVVDDHIRGRNTIPQEQMGGPEGKIAARNKVINIKADTTEPHSPEHMFTSRLGAEFDATAECPQWQAFLNQVVSSDTHQAKLQEYVGYCLHHWSMPYHKALFLVGPTASGKSTFLDTVNALLGEDTVASLTPQQLTSERFAPAEIYGKWANIRNDIPKETVKNTGTLKEVLAGDPLKAEEKRKDPFFFRPTAKHLFSANQLPEMEVDDEAFFRRILLVPFPETVPKADRDKHLADRLNDELPGILNWALEGLQRLLANGSFTGDRSPGKTQETWSKWGDSVERFASIALTDGSNDIPKSDVYDAYLEFCRSEGMPSDTQHMMTRELKREGYTDGRANVGGRTQRCFEAVSWTSRGQQLLDAAQGGDGEEFGGLSEYQ